MELQKWRVNGFDGCLGSLDSQRLQDVIMRVQAAMFDARGRRLFARDPEAISRSRILRRP